MIITTLEIIVDYVTDILSLFKYLNLVGYSILSIGHSHAR